MTETITDPDNAYQWILDNKEKLNRSELAEALDRYCVMNGYKYLNGGDIRWIWENISLEEEEIDGDKIN